MTNSCSEIKVSEIYNELESNILNNDFDTQEEKSASNKGKNNNNSKDKIEGTQIQNDKNVTQDEVEWETIKWFGVVIIAIFLPILILCIALI